MSRPKHRRCEICNTVTSRYRGTVRQGAVVMAVWERDPANGEQLAANGTVVRCTVHGAASVEPQRR